jgi:protease-4
MLTSGLWDKVGMSWDEVHDGEKATMFTGTHDYTPDEWARFEAWLDRVYVDFTGKVADGRKLPKEKVLEIAKGRIWSGQDAKNLGLVDELGGYDTALKLVKKAIGVADSNDVNLIVYPRPKKWYETLLQRDTAENSDKEATGQALARILQDVQPVARELHAAGIVRKDRDQDEVLKMPDFEAGK